MSATIDERVVKMEFDNKEFEKNVDTSISTLDRLKNALTFTKQKEQLSTLSDAVNTTKFDGMSDSLEAVKNKFSALEIAGITAIANLTSKAVDFGTNFLKSLTLDPIMTGFDKYAQITQSVQTILAATKEQGETIETVTDQIDKLKWFTDETSYSLTDMTSNIASFTSKGIKLGDAVTQMQGIASAAALAGANTKDASHAMLGFSNAMGYGFMSRQNWQFIQTAHMDTVQFKQALIDAALACGTLQQVQEGLYETVEGNEVSITNFQEAMKDAWITVDVMEDALSNYGAFSEELYKGSQLTGLTASELLEALEDYKEGSFDISKYTDGTKESIETMQSIMEVLSHESLNLGENAFRAAQEAKTFEEAIQSVKDAVSSGWATTFELIFGNYEEAKKLWTDVANAMYDLFAEAGNTRNEILELWREFGGRERLLNGFANLFEAIMAPINAATEGFFSMFPSIEGVANLLYNLTRRFEEFTASLQLSEQWSNRIYNVFKGLALVLKTFYNILKSVVYILTPAIDVFTALLDALFTIGEALFDAFTVFGDTSDQLMNFNRGVESAHDITQSFADVLVKVIQKMTELTKSFIGTKLKDFFELIKKGIDAVKEFEERTHIFENTFNTVGTVIGGALTILAKLVTTIYDIGRAILSMPEVQAFLASVKEELKDFGKTAFDGLQKFVEYLSRVDLMKFFNDIKDAASNLLNKLKELFNYLADRFKIVGVIRDELKKVYDQFKLLRGGVSAHTLYDDLGEPLEETAKSAFNFKEIFTKVVDGLKNFFATLDPGKIVLLGFTAAVIGIFITITKLIKSITTVADSASGLIGTLKSVAASFKKQEIKQSKFLDIAKGILLIAAAMAGLALVDAHYHQNLINAGIILAAIAAGLIIFSWALKGLANSVKKADSWKELVTLDGTLLALSASALILSFALNNLKGVGLKEAQSAILIIGELALVMAGITIILSRFAGKGFKGFLAMIAFALVLTKFADAMDKLVHINYSNIENNIETILIIFAAISAAAIAASNIGVFSAIGLLLFVAVISKIIPMLADLTENDFNAIMRALRDNKDVILMLAGIAMAMTIVSGLFGKGIKKFGTGMILFGVALLLASKAIDILGSMDPAKADQGLEAVTQLLLVFGALSLVLSLFNGGKGAVKVAIAIGLMSLALYPIAGMIWLLGEMDARKAKQGTDAVSQLMLCLAVVVAASKIPGKGTSFLTMLGIVGIIFLLVMEMLLLVDIPYDDIVKAAIGIDAVMVGLAVVFVSLAALGNQKSPMGAALQVIALAAVIWVIGDALAKIVPYPWESIAAAAVGLTAVLLALSKCFINIWQADPDKLLRKVAIFAGLCLTLYEIAGAIWLTAQLPLDRMLGAAGSLAGIVYVLGVVFNKIAKAKTDWKKAGAFAIMTASVIEIGFAISLLSSMPLSGMIAAALSLAGIVYVLSKVFDTIGSSVTSTGDVGNFLLMSLSLFEIGLPLYFLATMPWDGMLAAAAGLAVVALAMSKAFDIIGTSVADTKDVGNFLLMCLSLFEIGLPLYFLAEMPWDGMLGAAASLSIVLLAMSAAFDIIGMSVTSPADVGTFLLLTLSLIPIGLALYVLSEQHWENMIGVAASISMLLIAFTVVTIALQLVNPELAIMGCLGFIAVVAILMVVFGVIAALIELIPDSVYKHIMRGFDKFIEIAGKIGEVIGAFIGGIVGGGIMQALVGIGKGLSAFAREADPFVEWLSNIDPGLADGAKVLFDTLMLFSGSTLATGVSDFVDKLTHPVETVMGWFSGESYSSNAAALENMARGLKNFAEETAGINADHLKQVVEAAGLLYTADYPDPDDLEEFDAELLTEFANGLIAFYNAASQITDASKVDAAINVAQKIFSLDIPNYGGAAGFWLGDDNLALFNEELLGGFGKGLTAFVKETSGITDTKTAEPALTLASRLFALNPPNQGGALAWWVGDDNFEKFNEKKLGSFGKGLNAFVKATSEITDPTMADAAIGLAKKLFDLNPPNEGGALAWWVGDDNFEKFDRRKLGKFGDGLAAFVEKTANISPVHVAAAKTACEIANILDDIDLDNSGGFFGTIGEFFMGSDDYDGFADGLNAFGRGIKNFAKQIDKLDIMAITKAQIATQILEIITESDYDYILDMDKDDTDTIKSNLRNLAIGIAAYSENLEGIDLMAVGTAAIAVGSIVSVLKSFNNTKISNITSFANAMEQAGDFGISSFCNAFKNADRKIDAAVDEFTKKIVASVKSHQATIDTGLAQAATTNVESYVNTATSGYSLQSLIGAGNTDTSAYIEGAMDGLGMDSSGYSDVLGGMSLDCTDSMLTEFTNSPTLQALYNGGSMDMESVIGGMKDTLGMDSTGYSSVAGDIGINIDKSALSGITDSTAVNNLLDGAETKVVQPLYDKFAKGPLSFDSMKEIMKNALNGLDNGANDEGLIGKLKQSVYKVSSIMRDGFTGFWKEHSPSKVAEEDARNVVLGYALGFEKNSGIVVDAASSMASDSVDALKEATEIASDYVSENMDLNPAITPYLDLDGLMRDAAGINTMFENGKELTVNSRLGEMTDMFGMMNDNNLNGNAQVLFALNDLKEEVSNLQNVVSNLQVVMDSGSLVGAIVPDMDVALGNLAMQRRRGM